MSVHWHENTGINSALKNTSQDLTPGTFRYTQLPKQVFNAVRVLRRILASKSDDVTRHPTKMYKEKP
jgi:hypothetical protein